LEKAKPYVICLDKLLPAGTSPFNADAVEFIPATMPDCNFASLFMDIYHDNTFTDATEQFLPEQNEYDTETHATDAETSDFASKHMPRNDNVAGERIAPALQDQFISMRNDLKMDVKNLTTRQSSPSDTPISDAEHPTDVSDNEDTTEVDFWLYPDVPQRYEYGDTEEHASDDDTSDFSTHFSAGAQRFAERLQLQLDKMSCDARISALRTLSQEGDTIARFAEGAGCHVSEVHGVLESLLKYYSCTLEVNADTSVSSDTDEDMPELERISNHDYDSEDHCDLDSADYMRHLDSAVASCTPASMNYAFEDILTLISDDANGNETVFEKHVDALTSHSKPFHDWIFTNGSDFLEHLKMTMQRGHEEAMDYLEKNGFLNDDSGDESFENGGDNKHY